MPEHHRFLDANRPEAAVIEVMEIRTADAAGANANQQLMRFRFGRRDIFNAQIQRRVNHECMHGENPLLSGTLSGAYECAPLYGQLFSLNKIDSVWINRRAL